METLVEKVLETYTLAEILEYNDVTDEEVIELLSEFRGFQLPPTPVDSL